MVVGGWETEGDPDGREAFTRALDQHALWRAAVRALSPQLDPDALSDAAADIVVAVLAGELCADDIASRAADFLQPTAEPSAPSRR